jgi:RHS repeat-associated protein
MRFPGQQYDSVTGFHQNYFRDYDPGTGRYVQSDPIGLDGGISTYGYANGSPLIYSDPEGLIAGRIGLQLVTRFVLPRLGVKAASRYAQRLGARRAIASAARAEARVAGHGAARSTRIVCESVFGVKKSAQLLLSAPRQIQASWGVNTYRHGGLMSGIEHIMYRHGSNSGFANVSRFTQGTRIGDISRYVDSALRSGSVTNNGLNAYTVEYNVGRTIGTDISGNAASSIRLHIRDGIIQTAFPF